MQITDTPMGVEENQKSKTLKSFTFSTEIYDIEVMLIEQNKSEQQIKAQKDKKALEVPKKYSSSESYPSDKAIDRETQSNKETGQESSNHSNSSDRQTFEEVQINLLNRFNSNLYYISIGPDNTPEELNTFLGKIPTIYEYIEVNKNDLEKVFVGEKGEIHFIFVMQFGPNSKMKKEVVIEASLKTLGSMDNSNFKEHFECLKEEIMQMNDRNEAERKKIRNIVTLLEHNVKNVILEVEALKLENIKCRKDCNMLEEKTNSMEFTLKTVLQMQNQISQQNQLNKQQNQLNNRQNQLHVQQIHYTQGPNQNVYSPHVSHDSASSQGSTSASNQNQGYLVNNSSTNSSPAARQGSEHNLQQSQPATLSQPQILHQQSLQQPFMQQQHTYVQPQPSLATQPSVQPSLVVQPSVQPVVLGVTQQPQPQPGIVPQVQPQVVTQPIIPPPVVQPNIIQSQPQMVQVIPQPHTQPQQQVIPIMIQQPSNLMQQPPMMQQDSVQSLSSNSQSQSYDQNQQNNKEEFEKSDAQQQLNKNNSDANMGNLLKNSHSISKDDQLSNSSHHSHHSTHSQ